jgi:hypothetical protein
MAKKKHYEFREKKLERDGLKQRRLKDESRWRYNPNQIEEVEFEDHEDNEWDDYEEEYKF